MSDEADLAARFNAVIEDHAEHPWIKAGRCVFCGPCHVRLYQGSIPDGHPIYTPPNRSNKVVEDMRSRWGMDNRPNPSSDR